MEIIDKKDVFISYRRDGGATVARLLCEVLRNRGINVFFDTESLGSGDFDKKIKQQLHKADNFLFIVSPNVFDRCHDENDWVRKEIEMALETKGENNITPVFVNGVTTFPSDLPNSIRKISNINAVRLDHEHFNDSIKEIINRFISRKHYLMNAYLDVVDNYYNESEKEDKLISLIKVCFKLCNEDQYIEVVETLKDKIRLVSEDNTNNEVLDYLLENYYIDFSKDLCNQLGINSEGGMRKIKKNIHQWLISDNDETSNTSVDQYDAELNEYYFELSVDDRYGAFIKAFSREFKREELVGILDTFDGVDLARSNLECCCRLFKMYDIEEVFNKASKIKYTDNSRVINEGRIKNIASDLFEVNSGRKKILVDRIIKYVNYEI